MRLCYELHQIYLPLQQQIESRTKSTLGVSNEKAKALGERASEMAQQQESLLREDLGLT